MPFDLNNHLIGRFVEEELARQRAQRPQARFLDIGCGDLRYRRYSEQAGWQRIFSDYSPRTSGLSLQLDAHQIPFADDCLDVVLMTEVLEHLSHPEKSLKDIARALRGGGVLILTVPFLWGLHEVPSDFFRFTEFGLARLLADAGLEIVYFQRRGNLIGVLLSYFGILIGGFIEGLRRTRILAPLAWLLDGLTTGVAWLSYMVYLALFGRSFAVRHQQVGSGLKGFAGALAHQHLGYNVLCQKT